jgi:hypothetical protein
VTARVPFVAYFEGGTFEATALDLADVIEHGALSDPQPWPLAAEYERVRERWLDVDEAQAFQRDMPPGRHLVAAVYRYRRTI